MILNVIDKHIIAIITGTKIMSRHLTMEHPFTKEIGPIVLLTRDTIAMSNKIPTLVAIRNKVLVR